MKIIVAISCAAAGIAAVTLYSLPSGVVSENPAGVDLRSTELKEVTHHGGFAEKELRARSDDGIPSELLEWIARLKPSPKNQILAKAMLMAWGDTNAAIGFLRQNLPTAEQDQSITTILIEICTRRLRNFEKYAGEVQALTPKSRLVGIVIARWAAADPAYLANYAAQFFKDEIRVKAITSAIDALAKGGNINEALRWLEQLPPDTKMWPTVAVSAIAEQWAKRDVQAALEWAKTLEQPKGRPSVMQLIISRAAEKMDTAQIVVKVNEEKDPILRRTWVSALTNSILKQNLHEARVWAEQLPNEYRDDMMAKVAGALAASTPVEAAAYATRIGNQNSRANAVDSMLQGIGSDREKLNSWFHALPVDMQDRAASGVATKLFHKSPQLATEWVDTLSNGSAKDHANLLLASSFGNAEPERLAAAFKIVNPVLRNYAVQMVRSKK